MGGCDGKAKTGEASSNGSKSPGVWAHGYLKQVDTPAVVVGRVPQKV